MTGMTTARHGKGVLSMDKAMRGETVWLRCAWDECEHQGVTLHLAVHHAHAVGMACADPYAKHIRYVFCSERHRQYFLHSHRPEVGYGNLPVGERGRLT